jgi:hypothetical protein
MSATKLRFSYSVKATPTVLFPKLPLFFFAKTEKSSPTVLHLRLLFIPNWEKLLRVCIYGRNDPRRILAN